MYGSRLIRALILKLILLIVLAQTMYPDVAYTGAMSALFCLNTQHDIYIPLLMLHLIEIVINVTSSMSACLPSYT